VSVHDTVRAHRGLPLTPGEGPLWHPDEERLYWVDIPNGDLFRYDPATDEHEQCFERDVVGGFTVQDDGSLLLFEDGGRIERWVEGRGRPPSSTASTARPIPGSTT